MALYLAVTVFALTCAFFCSNGERVQLHIDGIPKAGRSRFGYIGRTRQQALNLWIGIGIYLVLTAVSACRIAIGNDYWEYTEMFSLIAQERDVASEPGFNMLVRLVQYLAGPKKYFYLPIFGIIAAATVFFFLKAIFDQGEWFLGTLFLFMMNGYYFSSFNSVRYYLVLAIAAYSMRYVLRGEYGKFALWILTAALFHKSVLVVLLLYPSARWLAARKLNKWHVLAGVLMVLSLVFGRDFYRWIMFRFYPYYEGSAMDMVRYSVTNIGKCTGTLALSLICFRQTVQGSLRNKFYFYLNLGGLVLYTCAAYIPEVSRIGYYLVISQIFLIPNMLMHMPKGLWKKLLTAGTAVAFLLHFALFLRTAYDTDIRILPYLNWIFN